MQRQAFEVTARWGAVEEAELDPPALERLAEIVAPTLLLTGDLDLDAIHDAATRVVDGVGAARHVRWRDVAHLPSMERPEDFVALVRSWWTEQERRG